jgi:hypothetical protein
METSTHKPATSETQPEKLLSSTEQPSTNPIEFVCLFRGLRENYKNMPVKDMEEIEKITSQERQYQHVSLTAKQKEEKELMEIIEDTKKKLNDMDLIIRYLEEHSAYIKINSESGFLSFSKIPDRAYFYGSYPYNKGPYHHPKYMGCILITILTKEEYQKLEKLDILQWRKDNATAPTKEDYLNIEVILNTVAPISFIVPITKRDKTDEYAKKCWDCAENYAASHKGTLNYVDNDGKFHKLDLEEKTLQIQKAIEKRDPEEEKDFAY